MTDLKIEVGKKYKTRDGRIARVICTDAKNKHRYYPIIALVAFDDDEIPYSYTTEGRYDGPEMENPFDIIAEHKEPLRVEFECNWVKAASTTGLVIYPNGDSVEELIQPFLWKNTRVIVEEIE